MVVTTKIEKAIRRTAAGGARARSFAGATAVLLAASALACEANPVDPLVGVWRSEETDSGMFWFVYRAVGTDPGNPKAMYWGCHLGEDEAVARKLFASREMTRWAFGQPTTRCVVEGDGSKRSLSMCAWKKGTCTPSIALARMPVEFAPDGSRVVLVMNGDALTWERVAGPEGK